MTNQYMKTAKSLARENIKNKNGGPFGACIVRNGQIVSQSANQVIKNTDPTAHAEILAIREACQKLNTINLSDCELYTSCFPCPMCLSAIIWANIKTVYYCNTKEDANKIGFRDEFIYNYIENLNKNSIKQDILELKRIIPEDAIEEFVEFENSNDKVEY